MQISILPFPIQKRSFRKLFPAGNVVYIYIYIRRSEEECRAPAGIGRFASQIYAANICKAGLLLPCLMDWSVHVTFCFSRHSNHSIVRYRFNSLETVSSSRGGLLPLVSFPEGPRGGNFREGLVLDRYRCPGDDDCVVGRSLMFVWCV